MQHRTVHEDVGVFQETLMAKGRFICYSISDVSLLNQRGEGLRNQYAIFVSGQSRIDSIYEPAKTVMERKERSGEIN